MQHIHLGLCMIRIHALHRQNTGTHALLVLRDTRWTDERAIIGTMEVDLNSGTQLVYIAPNLMMSIADFHNHMEICIQTKGYEGWTTAESNLLITRGLIGRLTNTSYAGFHYNIQNVADYLATNGIKAFEGQQHHSQHIGERWVLQPAATPHVLQPTTVQMSSLLDKSISIRFSGHTAAQQTEAPEVDDLDVELIHAFIQHGEYPEITDPEEREQWGLAPLQITTICTEGGGKDPDPIFPIPSDLSDYYQADTDNESEEESPSTYDPRFPVAHVEGDKGFNFWVSMQPSASAKIRMEDIIPTGWED